MGCDTGFEPYNEPFYENIRAGCEFGDVDIDMKATVEEARHYMSTVPRIFKAPDWSWKLKTFLGRGYVDIEYVILPFRDFDEAAKSRLSVGLDWMVEDDLTDPEIRQEAQAYVHAAMFGRVMEAAYLFRLPLTIIRYPDLVQSADYCYQRLTPIFDFDYDLFKEKHEELSWE
jgi:hypothetical protein